jgi:hypothetical protein
LFLVKLVLAPVAVTLPANIRVYKR